jgi:hypothetical protein
MSDATEIAALRQRNLDLEREVAVFRARERRRVLPGLAADFAQPSDAELRELAAIAWSEIPALRPTEDKREATLEMTRVAFLGIGCLLRTRDGSLNMRLDRSVWLDRAGTALSRAGLSSSFDMRAFFTALLAAGDVNYCIDPTRWPCDSYWSFADGDGKPADSAAWRRVLQTRRIRPATPLPKRPAGDGHPVGLVRQVGASW